MGGFGEERGIISPHKCLRNGCPRTCISCVAGPQSKGVRRLAKQDRFGCTPSPLDPFLLQPTCPIPSLCPPPPPLPYLLRQAWQGLVAEVECRLLQQPSKNGCWQITLHDQFLTTEGQLSHAPQYSPILDRTGLKNTQLASSCVPTIEYLQFRYSVLYYQILSKMDRLMSKFPTGSTSTHTRRASLGFLSGLNGRIA